MIKIMEKTSDLDIIDELFVDVALSIITKYLDVCSILKK